MLAELVEDGGAVLAEPHVVAQVLRRGRLGLRTEPSALVSGVGRQGIEP